jgi:hypothetical protein
MDGRLRVEEVPFYPGQIAETLEGTRVGNRPFSFDAEHDRVIVSVAVTPDLFDDKMRTLEDLRAEIQSEFLSRLGVEAEIRLREPRAFEGGKRDSGNRRSDAGQDTCDGHEDTRNTEVPEA